MFNVYLAFFLSIVPIGKNSSLTDATKILDFAAVGDIFFGRSGKKFGLDHPFRYVKKYFQDKDIVAGNLETPFSLKRYRNRRKPRQCKYKKCSPDEARYARNHMLTFWGRPRGAEILKKAGFTILGTANNHTFDQGKKGLLETISILEKSGLGVTGSGKILEKAWKPHIINKNGIKVGIISVTTLYNFPPPKKGAFYAYSPFRGNYKYLPPVITKLKKQVDFAVLMLHFGEEYKNTAFRFEKNLMDLLAKAGLDLLIGSHPHVLRGIQIKGKMIAFWSLGNFLFDNTWKSRKYSGIATLRFVKKGKLKRMEKIKFIPVVLNGPSAKDKKYGKLPRPAGKKWSRIINRKVRRYSRTFKNIGKLKIDGNHLNVILP
ncbi:MAG: CapA family protein [Deltaproteobacteria bacterium]|nr:CapA family protein [Deltaproteobacteria bacterium]